MTDPKLNGRHCVVCEAPLTGGQLKYDKEECKKVAAREAWLQATYSIGIADFEAIVAFQGGRCPICERAFGPSVKPVVDHEHGAHVRGVPCDYCNRRLIGRLKQWKRAANLADYLRDPPAEKALGERRQAPGRKPQKRTTRRFRRGQR